MGASEDAVANGPFKRVSRTQHPDRADETGKINIVIQRVERGTHVRGNISRSFTVQEGKVSEVADVIEKALFGESDG